MKGGIFMKMKRLMERWARGVRCAMAGRPVAVPLIGGGVLLLAATLVRGVCGSPYENGILLHCKDLLPPVWLMTLLWMVWYVLLGGAFALVMSDRRCDPYTVSQRLGGGMTYLGMLMLGFLWYPTFFCAGRVFAAALVVLGVLALCVFTALLYWRAYRPAALLLFAHALFLLWMLVLSVAVVFV
jgi:tryptophan-rich sensory protein